AAREMEASVNHPDYVLAVFDATGKAVTESAVAFPEGPGWRTARRAHAAAGQSFTVAIAAPMSAIAGPWRALVEACAIGIPFILALAAAGGWLLGRRGLRPLAELAAQARDVTAQTPDARLSVAGAGPELAAVATSFNRVLDRLNTALATQRRFMADAS